MASADLILSILSLVGIVLLLAVREFGFSYLTERGKNLATKQDVEEITAKIETVKAEIEAGQAIEAAKRQLKYEACLQALSMIDAQFAYQFQGANTTPQPADTVKVRECHNKLILSCDDADIVDMFLDIFLGPGSGQPDDIPLTDRLNEFRNRVRQELGFGSDISLNRDRAWMGRTGGDPNNPGELSSSEKAAT
jgi:hypothetical protein